MTRNHGAPSGCTPLFPRPRPTPSPKTPRSVQPARPHGSPLNGLPPDHDLLLRTLRPVLAHLSPDAVAFGRTAAYVWGVDLHPRGTEVTRNRLHVAVPPGVTGAARYGVRPHRERVPCSARTLVQGVRVTTPPRTALDVAAGASSLYTATAALDRFLSLRLTSRAELLAAALNHPRSRQRQMPRALRLADPRSQSPAESWARVLLYEAGLPRAQLQCPVPSAQGLLHADLGWPQYRVAVACVSAEHPSARHERARDRLRYAAMAEAGWTVLAIGVYDIRARPAGFLRRVLAALNEHGWEGSPGQRQQVLDALRRLEDRPPRLGEE